MVGLATGLAQVVQDKPVAGDQLYVKPDTAEVPIEVLSFLQIVLSGPALADGFGETVTITVSVLLHTPLVAVSVYVVVAAGLALGWAAVPELRPVTGAQL